MISLDEKLHRNKGLSNTNPAKREFAGLLQKGKQLLNTPLVAPIVLFWLKSSDKL